MSRTVVGIFDNYSSAEKATIEIKNNGFKANDISILSKDDSANAAEAMSHMQPDNTQFTNDNISDGVVTGTVLGGLTGLLVGIGTVVIPGLGVLAAAGPIVGLLSGAVTGGVVGGLVDLGIPEEDSSGYEDAIRHGKILLSIRCSDDEVSKATSIISSNGASSVKTY